MIEETDEEILSFEVSDEALERAAGTDAGGWTRWCCPN